LKTKQTHGVEKKGKRENHKLAKRVVIQEIVLVSEFLFFFSAIELKPVNYIWY